MLAITATTGMARLQFKGAQTLHAWSGYGDGHLGVNRILQRLNTNAAYSSVKENILKADVLMIDEIGLMSAQMFDAVEQICRYV